MAGAKTRPKSLTKPETSGTPAADIVIDSRDLDVAAILARIDSNLDESERRTQRLFDRLA